GEWEAARLRDRRDAHEIFELTVSVQLCVAELQVRRSKQVADLEALNGVAMAVHVHVPTLAEGFQHRLLRRVDERMPLIECGFCFSVATSRFRPRTIRVELASRDVGDDHVWILAEASEIPRSHRADEIDGVEIGRRCRRSSASRRGSI